MRATVISDQAECDRIWALADRVFAPYATYRREAAKVNRTIPIVQLTTEFAFAFWDHEEGRTGEVFLGGCHAGGTTNGPYRRPERGDHFPGIRAENQSRKSRPGTSAGR
jgi:hypothetical protein